MQQHQQPVHEQVEDDPSMINHTIPLNEAIYIHGRVTKGFGRGSSLLDMPTANLPADDYNDQLLKMKRTGVFIGWANVSGGTVYPTVLGIGDNPQFGDCLHRTIEPHLIHKFEEDFYGEELKLIICGYVRPYEKFESLEKLKRTMNNDKCIAEKALSLEPYLHYRHDPFFVVNNNNSSRNGSE